MSWTDTDAAMERESRREFLRNYGNLALDSKPTSPILESWTEGPTVAGLEWMTNINTDQAAMREASTIASFYEGVNYADGRRQEAAFRLRKLERRLEP